MLIICSVLFINISYFVCVYVCVCVWECCLNPNNVRCHSSLFGFVLRRRSLVIRLDRHVAVCVCVCNDVMRFINKRRGVDGLTEGVFGGWAGQGLDL